MEIPFVFDATEGESISGCQPVTMVVTHGTPTPDRLNKLGDDVATLTWWLNVNNGNVDASKRHDTLSDCPQWKEPLP